MQAVTIRNLILVLGLVGCGAAGTAEESGVRAKLDALGVPGSSMAPEAAAFAARHEPREPVGGTWAAAPSERPVQTGTEGGTAGSGTGGMRGSPGGSSGSDAQCS